MEVLRRGGRQALHEPPPHVRLRLGLRPSRATAPEAPRPSRRVVAALAAPDRPSKLDDVVGPVRLVFRLAGARSLPEDPQAHLPQGLAAACDTLPSPSVHVHNLVVAVVGRGGALARSLKFRAEQPRLDAQVPRHRNCNPLEHPRVVRSCPLDLGQVVLMGGIGLGELLGEPVRLLVPAPSECRLRARTLRFASGAVRLDLDNSRDLPVINLDAAELPPQVRVHVRRRASLEGDAIFSACDDETAVASVAGARTTVPKVLDERGQLRAWDSKKPPTEESPQALATASASAVTTQAHHTPRGDSGLPFLLPISRSIPKGPAPVTHGEAALAVFVLDGLPVDGARREGEEAQRLEAVAGEVHLSALEPPFTFHLANFILHLIAFLEVVKC